MEAKELRIGNYYWSGYNCTISKLKGFIPEDSDYEIGPGLSFTGYLIEGCDKLINWGSLDPIELTEEWLLKLDYVNRIENYWSNGILEIRFDNDDMHFYYEYLTSSGRTEILVLQYIHQLQNLYFALTGKELILI